MVKRIKVIDALRGIAALVVVIHHFMTFFVNAVKSGTNEIIVRLLNFISNLNTEAVLFFFIISGFSIGLSLKDSLPLTRDGFLIYTKKRLVRILPVYVISILISIVIGFVTHSIERNSDYGLVNLFGNLLFLQTPEGVKHWFTPYGDNGPLWSLSYEMFFYLFFPVFVYSLSKCLKIIKFKPPLHTTLLKYINIIFIILLLITLSSLVLNTYVFFTPWFSFLSLFVIWFYGYILFLIFRNEEKNDIHFILMFCSSLILYLNQSVLSSDTMFLIVKGLLMISLIYAIIRFNHTDTFKLLLHQAKKVLVFLFYKIGAGSYALYAFHYIILKICVYFKFSLSETIVSLIITIISCIEFEKFIAKITAKKIRSTPLHNKEVATLH